METSKKRWLWLGLLLIPTAVFLAPLVIVVYNSFKGQFDIAGQPFLPPTAETFVGWENYRKGIEKIGFFSAAGYSFWITVGSVVLLVLFTAMTAWYLVRIRNPLTSALYYAFVFSMVIPFQMVMFTMSKTANIFRLDNPWGILLIYLGFGAGLSVFLYAGFLRSIPRSLEEAAVIDGCTPWQTFFRVIFPLLRPISITVAILNAMWIWNDYLLPYLVIGNRYKTIPIAVQYLQGGYGSRDMGALMAMLVLSILPIVIFYLFGQKYIIRGIAAGAVKG